MQQPPLTLLPTHKRFKQRLRQTNGVIDLASIMVGVIIVGILSTGIVATTFALVPFTQDAAAKKALDSASTAEGAAYVAGDQGRYLAMDDLVAGKWIQASDQTVVGTDADGTCYAAMSLSATGNRFWTDNSTADIVPYIAGTSASDCLDLDALSDTLVSADSAAAATGVLDAIRDAEDVAYADAVPNEYVDMAGLVAAGLVDESDTTVVEVNPDASGFAAMTVTASGAKFWIDSGTSSVLLYVAGESVSAFYGLADLSAALDAANASAPAASASALAGIVTTVAGSGVIGSANGAAAVAEFYNPTALAVHSDGTIYVADMTNNLIRKIAPDGQVSTLAGSGVSGSANGTGTGAQFKYPRDVAVDSAGTVYVADDNDLIRKITPAGVVTTLAGSGVGGFNDAFGAAAQFDSPFGIAVDSAGFVYVADAGNNRIRKITPEGDVTTLAGSTVPSGGYVDGPGATAEFTSPQAIAVDSDGFVYVGESDRIRKITPAGEVSTLAGGYGYVDGPGVDARFKNIGGVAVDSMGTIYVADIYNTRIREITPAGFVTTLAGSGEFGFADGTRTGAQFYTPRGVAVDSSGDVYVADSGNHRIRKIE